MSDGQDASWAWVAIVAGLSSVAAYGAGALSRGWSWARARGESDGEMRTWRSGIEIRLADISAQSAASEARINLRLTSLEARKERIDDLMRNVPEREEMNERFDRIDRRIEQLVLSMNRDAWGGPPRSTP